MLKHGNHLCEAKCFQPHYLFSKTTVQLSLLADSDCAGWRSMAKMALLRRSVPGNWYDDLQDDLPDLIEHGSIKHVAGALKSIVQHDKDKSRRYQAVLCLFLLRSDALQRAAVAGGCELPTYSRWYAEHEHEVREYDGLWPSGDSVVHLFNLVIEMVTDETVWALTRHALWRLPPGGLFDTLRQRFGVNVDAMTFRTATGK